jgi:hypothetical protein
MVGKEIHGRNGHGCGIGVMRPGQAGTGQHCSGAHDRKPEPGHMTLRTLIDSDARESDASHT